MNRQRLTIGLVAVALGLVACGSDPTTPPTPSPPPPAFDVQLISTTPSSGGTLELASPNNTAVALSLTFSVTVPPNEAGTYFWTAAVQAQQPPGSGSIGPVVTTSPFLAVALVAGTQNVTIQPFHTTNAVCSNFNSMPGTSTSLDIEIKTVASFEASPFFGKKFPATFALHCG